MVVFDKNEEQIVATLKGHTKKVTSVIYHPSQVIHLSFVVNMTFCLLLYIYSCVVLNIIS